MSGVLRGDRMVNPNVMLNKQQLFWVEEILTALPKQISMEEAQAGNFAAMALVGLAQYINSCQESLLKDHV